MDFFEKWIGSVFNSFGFELRRHPHRTNPEFQLLRGLQYFEIDRILDVGANTGQFASQLRKLGFKGSIVSFEPLLSAHNGLLKTSALDPNWIVHPRCAIGDHEGEIMINVSDNSVSSSILPILESHTRVELKSKVVTQETVPIYRLDTIASTNIDYNNNTLLKIDTQGYEWNVLDGANTILPKLRGVHCEISLVPLYAGQRLWVEVLNRLEKVGLTLWNLQPGFTDMNKGRTLQIDATFFNTNKN